MKKYLKKGICLLLAGTLAVGTGVTALAKTSESSGDDREVVVSQGDRPYLALGEDLSLKQRSVVLDLLGVEESSLKDYDVVYISNEQEHKYLGDYIPKSKIGTNALSSVVVLKGDKGSGVNVTTKNINYCTTGMYENAMVTAGIEDAQAIVAAPSEISGTAALIGVIEAYSVMSGEDIDEEQVDAAVNEMVITGEIEEETGETDQIEGMVAYLKEQVVSGEVKTKAQMKNAIDEAEKKFEVTLTEEQQQKLIELLEKIEGLDLDLDSLKQQAQNIYDKLSDLGMNIDTEALKNEAKGFFARLIQAIKNFFSQF